MGIAGYIRLSNLKWGMLGKFRCCLSYLQQTMSGLSGTAVYKQTMSGESATINVSSWANGVYIIIVETGNRKITGKIVKEWKIKSYY